MNGISAAGSMEFSPLKWDSVFTGFVKQRALKPVRTKSLEARKIYSFTHLFNIAGRLVQYSD